MENPLALDNNLAKPQSNTAVADNQDVMTMGDFMSQNNPNGSDQIVTVDDFMNGTTTPHQDYAPVAEEHKPGFLKGIAMNLYAGFEQGSANFQDFIGMGKIPYFKTGIENGRKKAQEIFNITHSDNFGVQEANKLTESLGNLGATLPIDIVTGQTLKTALAGSVLPAVESALSKLPDFALGSGLRGMIEEINKSHAQGDNPIISDVKGIAKGVADTALNASFATAGTGLKGITTMAAIGGGLVVSEAAGRGQYPSKEELASGMAQGAAYGVIFSILPHLAKATKLEPEKLALQNYGSEISRHVAEGDFQSVKESVDSMVKDEAIRPEIRDTVIKTLKESAREQNVSVQFDNGNSPAVLDYLAQYVPAKQVAKMSSEERLNLANGPWQKLRDLSVEPQKESPITNITNFKNQKEAIDFAKNLRSNPNVLEGFIVDELNKRSEESKSKVNSLLGKNATEEEKSLAIQEAKKGQLYRDAIDTINGVDVPIQANGKSSKKSGVVQTKNKKDVSVASPSVASTAAGQEAKSLNIRPTVEGTGRVNVTEVSSGVESSPKITSKTTKVSSEQLPVGTGAEKATGLEARVKAALESVPEDKKSTISNYKEMNKVEQMKAASQYVIENPEDAIAVLKGQKTAPEGLLHNSIALALEQHAANANDANLILKLASLRSTRAGQEISILTERDVNSPIKYIDELQQRKIESLGENEAPQKVREAEIKKAQKAIKDPTKEDWTAFIESIKC